MGLFVPGIPRLGILTSGVRTSTLYLPMPDKGLPEVEWIDQKQVVKLWDGSFATRRLGFVPRLTFRWSVYVDQITASFTDGFTEGAWGITIGSSNGQMPSILDLLLVLSATPGTISVSPGPSAGGFAAQDWDIKPIKSSPTGHAVGLEIAFTGGQSQASMVLGSF
jgi:hypothetical protein